MKKSILFAVLGGTLFIGCSKDDSSKKCESCTLDGAKVEACDNGDGTWTITANGSTTTFSEGFFDLLGMTPKQYIESICTEGSAL